MLTEWTSIFANNPYICSNYDPFSCGQCLSALCWHRCRDLDTHTEHGEPHTPIEARALIKHRRIEISCFWSISNQLIMVIFLGNVNKYFVASYARERGRVRRRRSMAPERRAIWNVRVQVEQSKLLTNDVYPLLVTVCTWCVLQSVVVLGKKTGTRNARIIFNQPTDTDTGDNSLLGSWVWTCKRNSNWTQFAWLCLILAGRPSCPAAL